MFHIQKYLFKNVYIIEFLMNNFMLREKVKDYFQQQLLLFQS
jgi:hypothetical protein